MASGGYRKPGKPAAVSGPGKYSRRTDGGPGETLVQAARYIQGDEYGESKELNELATSAPLSAGAGAPDVQTPEAAPPRNPQLTDATGRPDEPVITGMSDPSLVTPPAMDGDELGAAVRAAFIARPSQETLRLLIAVEEQGL